MGTFMRSTGLRGGRIRWTKLLAWPLLVIGAAAFAEDAPSTVTTAQHSIGEMTSLSREYLTKMQDTQRQVLKLKDQATKKKDILKLACVNDKLTQLKGHMVVADQSMTAFSGAQQRGDTGATSHEFTRLTIIYQKVLVLGTEAENCIGGDVNYVGATKVDVEIDPSVPSDEPEPQLPLPVPTRPAEATPFA